MTDNGIMRWVHNNRIVERSLKIGAAGLLLWGLLRADVEVYHFDGATKNETLVRVTTELGGGLNPPKPASRQA